MQGNAVCLGGIVALCYFVSNGSSFSSSSSLSYVYGNIHERKLPLFSSRLLFIGKAFDDKNKLAARSANHEKSPSSFVDVQRRISLPFAKIWKSAKRFGRSLLSLIGRLAAKLPTRILRILIGGFVKELKKRQLSLEELHYILMDDLNLNDIYRVVFNERSLNLTAAEYGGIVNFLDAKAKLEASKILPDLDRDKDGQVSPEEVLQFVSESVSTQLTGAIETLDADGDGRLTPSDFFHYVSDRMRDAMFQAKKNPPGS